MNCSIIASTYCWYFRAYYLRLTLVLYFKSYYSSLSIYLYKNFTSILNAPFLFNSLNSSKISCDVLVIIQCCLKAAFLNHLVYVNYAIKLCKFWTDYWSSSSLDLDPLSWLICFWINASRVYWISSPCLTSYQR